MVVVAYLQQWGYRIQRSVFVCALAPNGVVEEVTADLTAMVELATDAVHILPACATCWSKLAAIGQVDREPDRPYWAAL